MFKGPEWMANFDEWPDDIATVASKESESEVKPPKQIVNLAVENKDELDMILDKFRYTKSMDNEINTKLPSQERE